LLLVHGSPVVRRDEVLTIDEGAVADEVRSTGTALLARAGVIS
jgi:hypothetical protein